MVYPLETARSLKEQSVFNSANLSLWMVNASQAILARSGEESILDLKAKSRYHAIRYAQELFKTLPKNTKLLNIIQLFERPPVLVQIHVEKMAA